MATAAAATAAAATAAGVSTRGQCYDHVPGDADVDGERARLVVTSRIHIALPALAQARAKGIELAVVSNMDSRLPAILESLELRPLLSAVYYPAESGRAKPDRALYLEACRALGVAPAHALYVGDRERDCLAGARQAGLAVLRYAPGSGDTEELHDWAELLDRVAASGC